MCDHLNSPCRKEQNPHFLQINATGNSGPAQRPARRAAVPSQRKGHFLVPISYGDISPRNYLIQELSRFLSQRVMGEHAVVAIDAVPSCVVQLTRKITFMAN